MAIIKEKRSAQMAELERQKEENPRSILYAFHFTTHSIHHESGRI